MLLKRAVQHGAAYVQGLSPAAWFRYGQGITVTGAGVSQWDDQSGNSRHLKQGTDGNRPSKEADNTILFDGVDNFLATDAFTLDQPFSVYIRFKQVSWAANDRVFDGATQFATLLDQFNTTPRLRLTGDAGLNVLTSNDLAVGAYGTVVAIYNGASSVLQVNSGAASAGQAGANNAGGFTLGASGTGAEGWSNIQVKEVIIFAVAHDAIQRAAVIGYLAQI